MVVFVSEDSKAKMKIQLLGVEVEGHHVESQSGLHSENLDFLFCFACHLWQEKVVIN